jgi:dTDP-4-dehydrorhamnose reductase
MTRILITGANGQLGSEIKEISKRSEKLVFLFHDVDTLDITDFEKLNHFVNSNQVKYIVNCAAYTAVDKAESETDKAKKINVDAVRNIVRSAGINQAFVIHISTDYVFDGTANKPYGEEVPVNPVSVYGRTKEEGEHDVIKYSKGMVIRTAWLYSTFGNNIVKTVLKLGRERTELNFVFDQTGSPTYAADLATAIITIIQQSEENESGFKAGVYHYSNEGVCSWYDFVKAIVRIKGLKCKVNPIETSQYPAPATRPVYSVLNKKKIKNTYALEIPYWLDSLENCLKKMI